MKRLMRFLGIGLPTLGSAILLNGCDHLLLLNPKGPIGMEERFVIIAAIALMLIIVIPVAIMTFWFFRNTANGLAIEAVPFYEGV